VGPLDDHDLERFFRSLHALESRLTDDTVGFAVVTPAGAKFALLDRAEALDASLHFAPLTEDERLGVALSLIGKFPEGLPPGPLTDADTGDLLSIIAPEVWLHLPDIETIVVRFGLNPNSQSVHIASGGIGSRSKILSNPVDSTRTLH
jgi:hypothetical protein